MDTNPAFNVKPSAGGTASIELGKNRGADGTCYLDFVAEYNASPIDYNARFVRNTGVNGVFSLLQAGTGAFELKVNALDVAISMASNQVVTMPSLAGSGTRNVVVDDNGVLSAP